MTDNSAKTMFRFVGVVNSLYAVLMGFIFVVVLVGFITATLLLVSESSSEIAAESLAVVGLSAIVMLISLASFLINAFSAYGFFKLKKWQPNLFVFVVILTILDIIVNFTQTGFVPGTLISIFFVFVWIGLLVLTRQKKHMFVN